MRKFDKLSRMRYCGMSDDQAPYKKGMNWHGAELGHTGRMYRCMCMPSFRIGNERLGPNGFPRRKAWKYKSENRDLKHLDTGRHLPDFN